MVNYRQQGLSFIWGSLIASALSVLFLLQTWFAVEVIEYTRYELINYPTYLIGIFLCTIYKVQNFYQIGNTMWSAPSWRKSVSRSNSLIILVAFITFGISFITKDKGIGRLFVIVYIFLSWLVVLWWFRFGVSFFIRKIVNNSFNAKTILIGDCETIESFRNWYDEQLPLGLELSGYILLDEQNDESQLIEDLKCLGRIDQMDEIFATTNFQQVIYLDPFLDNEKVERINAASQKKGARLWFLSNWKQLLQVPLHYYEGDKIAFFQVAAEPLESPLNRIFKRILDVFVSLFALTIIMPPVLLLVWMKQKKESPGKLFFKQKRAGFFNQVFTIYKFRTMHEGHDLEVVQAQKNDPRVFNFGAFLRRHNLDEFPQFWNVLLGKMSVVGPRPHMIEHDQAFKRIVEGYAIRSLVKPGLTGYAQIHGFRGEVITNEDINKRIELDHYYIRNWSIWLDCKIIVVTIGFLFKTQKSAY